MMLISDNSRFNKSISISMFLGAAAIMVAIIFQELLITGMLKTFRHFHIYLFISNLIIAANPPSGLQSHDETIKKRLKSL